MKTRKTVSKGLTLLQGDDGHWLSFESTAGKHASICLENQKGIAGAAMLAWAKDFWQDSSNKCNPACVKTGDEKMAFISRMKGQDYIDKTREYLDYVEEHLENVRKAFCELSKVCEGMWWVGDDMSWHTLRADVEWHDVSKLSQAELVPYTDQFYPTEHEPMEYQNNGFDKAWEHHKKHNHHHHESIRNFLDIVHMIIDWTAMGYKFGDTAQDYYEANKSRIKLTDEEKAFMYEIFDKIKTDKETKD